MSGAISGAVPDGRDAPANRSAHAGDTTKRSSGRRIGRAQRNPSPAITREWDDGFRFALPILLLRPLLSSSGAISGAVPDGRDAPANRSAHAGDTTKRSSGRRMGRAQRNPSPAITGMDDGFRFALPILLLRPLLSSSGAISGAAPDGRDAPAYRPLMRATTVEAVSRRVVDGEILTHTRGHS